VSSMRTQPFTIFPSKRVPKGEHSTLLQKKLETQIRTLWCNPYSHEILQLEQDPVFQSTLEPKVTIEL
jgi:hypothetical protein